MPSSDQIEAIFEGRDPIEVIDSICEEFSSKPSPPAPVQTLLKIWEAMEFIGADGFEILFEQGREFKYWTSMFEQAEVDEILPILQKVSELVPEKIYLPEYTSNSRQFIEGKCDELEKAYSEFVKAEEGILEQLCRFVKNNPTSFFPDHPAWGREVYAPNPRF